MAMDLIGPTTTDAGSGEPDGGADPLGEDKIPPNADMEDEAKVYRKKLEVRRALWSLPLLGAHSIPTGSPPS